MSDTNDKIVNIVDKTCNYVTQAIADAYNLGYQAAELNAKNMADAGIEPIGPYKASTNIDNNH